jgi:lysozyme
MISMRMSDRGRQRLTDREGKVLKAYRDTQGIPTIGVGHTTAAGEPRVVMGMMITAEECDQILIRDLAKFENILNASIRVPVADHEYDALLSVMFNVGPKFATSTAIRRLNEGDRKGCAAGIAMWNKPPEIIRRRQTEVSQFLTPYK